METYVYVLDQKLHRRRHRTEGLTFEQLQYGFAACLILLVMSTIVFIIEVMVPVVSTQVVRIFLYFAIKAYEQRINIGPERLLFSCKNSW